MLTKRIEQQDIVIPQNVLERDILEHLMMHMGFDGGDRYWDVKRSMGEPLTADEREGRIWVSWNDSEKERQTDRFSICRHENGYFVVVKMPRGTGK